MTSQHDVYPLHVGLARLHARMRMHTPTRPGTHMHVRTLTHAQTNKLYLLLFHGNNDYRQRLIVTLYVCHFSCLILLHIL